MSLAARWTLLVFVLASLMQAPSVLAQTTTGNATTGGNLWASKGRGSVSCHAPSAKPTNAANAGGHITYAVAQGMPATVLSTEVNDIAAYLANFAPDPNPVNVAIPYNTATAIPLPNIYLNSTYGKFTSLQTVTAPTKGSVSYSLTTATYTPTAGQTGADSFIYKAIVAGGCTGGCSNDRKVTVNIGLPVSVLTVYNQGTGTGTVVSSPPGLNCNAPVCSASFPIGTVVMLTATTDPGSAFVSLNFQPSNTLQLTLNANDNAFVNFNSIANDNFASPFPMVPSVSTGSSYVYKRLYNFGATKEAGEPNHASNMGGSSFWYSWTAPFTGAVNVGTGSSVNLHFSDFNTLLAVYTGNAVNALTLVAANDDFTMPSAPTNVRNLLSSVTFQAIAGTTYKIAVDGFNAGVAAETGKIDLTIIQPGNDSFAARLPLTGSNITLTDNNTGAYATDPGEPMHAGNAGGTGHRIVFQFNRTVVTPGTVAVTDAAGMPLGMAGAAALGNEVTVTLTNITNAQRAKVTLTNINGEGLNASASVGFVIGDINNSRSVDSIDISSVKARSGEVTDASNFRFDLNASGVINATDISVVKARINSILP